MTVEAMDAAKSSSLVNESSHDPGATDFQIEENDLQNIVQFLLILPEHYAFAMKFILAAQIGIVASGLLANIVCIRTFFKMGLNDCVTITFFNLAITDFSVLFIYSADILVKVVHVIKIGFQPFPAIFGMDSVDLQFFVWKFHDTFIRASLLFIAFLATQRALCVIQPFHFKAWFTRGRTFGVVLGIWAYCLIFAATQFSFIQIAPKSGESDDNATAAAVNGLFYCSQAIIGWIEYICDSTLTVVCLVSVVLGLTVMTYGLLKSMQFRQQVTATTTGKFGSATTKDAEFSVDKEDKSQNSSSASNSKERQAILQVAILSAFFLVAFVPNVILASVLTFIPKLVLMEYYFFRQLCVQINATCALANASVNFLVYFRYNTKFRQVLSQKKV